jgi:hypothetical protein
VAVDQPLSPAIFHPVPVIGLRTPHPRMVAVFRLIADWEVKESGEIVSCLK